MLKGSCVPAPKRSRLIFVLLNIAVFVLTFTVICTPLRSEAVSDDPGVNVPSDGVIRICIDPGHGGENLGAELDDYLEKDMSLIVAESMRDELQKYEGIEVYMTRTSDVDMTIEERVDYAEEIGADFFFCLHFNMSAEHDMYGAECWISAFGNNYARGMDFAKIEMDLLTDLGLYDRGIKTRLNNSGTNYYGVLRFADLAGFPGIIIEHCHLDNYNDEPYYDHRQKLEEYGRLDATAVAMYYGLYSPELGKDYRTRTYQPTPVPDGPVKPDETPPDELSVLYGEPYETDSGYWIDAEVTASDPDCRILYYSYSTDGGVTWTERYRWQDDEGQVISDAVVPTIHTTVPISSNRDSYLVFKVYNLYNLDIDSSPYFIARAPEKEETDEENSVEGYTEDAGTAYEVGDPGSDKYSGYTDISPYDKDGVEYEDNGLFADSGYVFIFAGLALAILLVLCLMGYVIYNRFSNRRNR